MTVMRARPLVALLVTGSLALIVVAISQTRALRPVEPFVIQFLSPLQWAVDRAVGWVANVRLSLEDQARLQSENQRLQEENQLLRSLILNLREVQAENRILREQLGFVQVSPTYDLLPAQVIGRDVNNLLHSLAINKGTQDGVREGRVVVAAGRVRISTAPGDDATVITGLVGRVIQAGPNYARILLITDPSSTVNVMVQGTRATGVVNGQVGGSLTLSYVPQGEQLKRGDVLVTSGLGGNFPRGLPVGIVASVDARDLAPFQSGQVLPIIDTSHLEIVFVVRNFDPIRMSEGE